MDNGELKMDNERGLETVRVIPVIIHFPFLVEAGALRGCPPQRGIAKARSTGCSEGGDFPLLLLIERF
jgi:hypothetical protein